MPGRTFDVLFLSGITGFIMVVCGAIFGSALLGGAFDRSLSAPDSISDTDISARRMSPR